MSQSDDYKRLRTADASSGSRKQALLDRRRQGRIYRPETVFGTADRQKYETPIRPSESGSSQIKDKLTVWTGAAVVLLIETLGSLVGHGASAVPA
jgi:hypothetical protein